MEIKVGITPWDHQTTIIRDCSSRQSSFVYAGCATGKTFSALATAVRLKATSVLVLSTKTALRSVWEAELNDKFTGFETLVLDKGNSDRKANDLARAWAARKAAHTLCVIVNYETAWRLPLEQYPFDLAIADESHNLKSHNSKQSLTLAEKCERIPYKIAMTGTPWDDRPTDVYGQMRWIRPVRVGGKAKYNAKDLGYWSHFFEEYVNYRTSDNIKIPTGYKNQGKLSDILKPYLTTVDRSVLNLPKAKHQHISVDLAPGHLKIYNDMRDKMIANIDRHSITADNILVQAIRLHQIASGFYEADGKIEWIKDGDAKLNALSDIVDSLGGQPFVVFTNFRPDIDKIQATLKVPTLRLQGGCDEHIRWKTDNTQGLLVNLSTGSAAVDLTKAAYAIYYTYGYSRTDYTQSLARIDRPNVSRPATFYHIAANKTIDLYIQKMLREKGETSEKLLNLILDNA